MVKCCVASCNNDNYGDKRKPGITFFRFPLNRFQRCAWIEKINVTNWNPNKVFRVCSEHFEEKYVYHTVDQRRLKNDAIPTLLINDPSPQNMTVKTETKASNSEENGAKDSQLEVTPKMITRCSSLIIKDQKTDKRNPICLIEKIASGDHVKYKKLKKGRPVELRTKRSQKRCKENKPCDILPKECSLKKQLSPKLTTKQIYLKAKRIKELKEIKISSQKSIFEEQNVSTNYFQETTAGIQHYSIESDIQDTEDKNKLQSSMAEFRDSTLSKDQTLFKLEENLENIFSTKEFFSEDMLADSGTYLIINLPSTDSPSEICRLCLSPVTEKKSVNIWEDESDYANKINDCFAIICQKKVLGNRLCIECAVKLDELYEFRLKCQKNNEEFVNKYSSDYENFSMKDELSNYENASILKDDNVFMKDNDIFSDQHLSEEVSEHNNSFDKKCVKPKSREKCEEMPCHQCPMICYDADEYKIHLNSHISRLRIKDMIRCNVTNCQKTFGTIRERRNHFQICHINNIPKIDVCPFCGKVGKKHDITLHIDRKHVIPEPCALCGKAFTTKLSLMLHVQRHHDKKFLERIDCKLCGKKVLKCKKSTHNRMVHLNTTYDCQLCVKKFKTKFYLETHIRTHTGERPFVCPECSERFISKVKLETHTAKIHGMHIFLKKGNHKEKLLIEK